MSNDKIALTTFVIGLVIGAVAMGFISSNGYRNLAVKHQCAEYNKTTGEFQWIDIK